VIGDGQQTNQTAILPPIESVVRQMSDRFNERLLPAPQVITAQEIDAEEADDAEEEDV